MPVKTKSRKLPDLTDINALNEAAECLKTLAHAHRLRMVQMLLRGRYTVGELAEACGIPSHMASEHLRLMQHCGFLTSEKEGRKAYYQIIEPQLSSIMAWIKNDTAKAGNNFFAIIYLNIATVQFFACQCHNIFTTNFNPG
jgi:ArsR family transcriptional regulator, zinc-responsive transcriptional repressor